jgi:hypothetical protein
MLMCCRLAAAKLYGITLGVALGFTNDGAGVFSVKVTTNYSHSSVQTAYFRNAGTCDTVTPKAITTSYTTWANNLSSGNYTANLGTLLQPTNGAGAFTGADATVIQHGVAGLTISTASDFTSTWATSMAWEWERRPQD